MHGGILSRIFRPNDTSMNNKFKNLKPGVHLSKIGHREYYYRKIKELF